MSFYRMPTTSLWLNGSCGTSRIQERGHVLMPRFHGAGKSEDVVGRSVKFRGVATSSLGL